MSLREIVLFAAALFVVNGVGVEGNPIKDHNLGKSPYFWRINSTPPSYLFGTIHVPYTQVWDSVSDDAKSAFNSARQVFLELAQAPETLDVSCALLPPGRTLAQVKLRYTYMDYVYNDLKTGVQGQWI